MDITGTESDRGNSYDGNSLLDQAFELLGYGNEPRRYLTIQEFQEWREKNRDQRWQYKASY